jgi:hypothetical protein
MTARLSACRMQAPYGANLAHRIGTADLSRHSTTQVIIECDQEADASMNCCD